MESEWIVLLDGEWDGFSHASEALARTAAHEACKDGDCKTASVYRLVATMEAVDGADGETLTVCTNAE